MPAKQTVDEWISKHVDQRGPDECWPASGGGYNKKGWHVSFRASGVRYMAHRAAYEQVHGPITNGLFVLHKCDNPKCCNPEHLFLGTQSDNAKDMWDKGRGNVYGHPGSTLGPSPFRAINEDGVRHAVSMFLSGSTQRQIGAVFGVSDVVISNIFLGKQYAEYADIVQPIKHLLGRSTKLKLAAQAKAKEAVKLRATGLSQYKVAELMHVSQSTVSNLERSLCTT